jgi:RimJ/RimL family protein N-acetyltransferase
MLIWPSDDATKHALIEWAQSRIPHLYGGELPPCVIGGVVRSGVLQAAVAFYDARDQAEGWRTLGVSVAADSVRWARPSVLYAIFQYAFEQARADLLVVGTPHKNEAAIKLLRHLGFHPDGIRRHRYGHKLHAADFSMTRAEWQRGKWFMEAKANEQ